MASPISAVQAAANANSSSSSGDSSTSSNVNQQISESTFLQLLVAQLQNQDPLQPMDGMQFVTQLAFRAIRTNWLPTQPLLHRAPPVRPRAAK